MTYLAIAILVFGALVLALHLWTLHLARRAIAAVPPAGDTVAVKGGTIHHVEMGPADAPPLVLIHGLAAQLQHFTYGLAERLAGDFRVIVIDRPGSGYSARDHDDLAALPEQARMIGEFLDAKGIVNPVVAGHSLGGAVTLALALDRPDRIAAIALLAPLTHWQDEIDPIFKGLEIRAPAMRRLIGNTIAAPLGNVSKDKVFARAFEPETPVPDFLIRAGAILGFRPGAFIGASSDLVALETSLPPQIERYGELSVPGGVLYGDGDVLLAPATHGPAMTAFGLEYEELPGRGHMLPFTAQAECADFIRRVAAKSAQPAVSAP